MWKKLRVTGTLIVVSLLARGAPASAQQIIDVEEELDFDRPESWAMKFFASLALMTGMGVPQSLGSGGLTLGFEGGSVPQLSEEERRVGFEGTKIEDLNRTRFLGRIRGAVGLSEHLSLELAYLPPIEVDGTTPNIFAAALGRPFSLSDTWELGVRGHGQFGTIEGDITCSAEEAAAGNDPELNPFFCMAPSNDELTQLLFGAELTVGYHLDSPFRPYVGVGFNYLDLDFQVDALYGDIDDMTKQMTEGGTVSLVGGLTYVTDGWRVTGELFYSGLSVVRPPSTSSQNDALWNARFLVTYRLR